MSLSAYVTPLVTHLARWTVAKAPSPSLRFLGAGCSLLLQLLLLGAAFFLVEAFYWLGYWQQGQLGGL